MKKLLFIGFIVIALISCQKETLEPPKKTAIVEQFAWVDNVVTNFTRASVTIAMVQKNAALTYYQEILDDKTGRSSIDGYLTRQGDTCAIARNGNCIVFIGNSELNNWASAWLCFPGYGVLNRAFGGSKWSQITWYMYDILLPYKPRQIVFNDWENEVIQQDPKHPATGRSIYNSAVITLEAIRKILPNTKLSVIKGQMRPKLVGSWNVLNEYNSLMATYVATHSNMSIINLDKGMYNADGSPKESLYRSDRLHVNLDGYNIWTPQLKLGLLK